MTGPNDANVSTDVENDVYPRMSYLSEVPSISTTLNLNWFREFAYFEITGGPAGQLGESVYERYWNNYIQSLYSPFARKVTAYFNLDSEDLRKISFDDLVFLNNAYYRIIKVYDAPLNDIATVKVDLVKILDSVIIENNGTPTDTGGGIDPDVPTGGGGTDIPVDEDDIWSGNDTNYGDNNGTWGNPTSQLRIYQLQACINPGDNVYAYYQSVTALAPSDAVEISGAIHADICYQVIGESTQPPTSAILQVYADCNECQNA